MKTKYKEHSQLNLPEIDQEILEFWKKNDIFGQSVSSREGSPIFSFYEGPPSANGVPGIHHVMARTVKDIFCRFKTLSGYQVPRKGGWDTHGLPIELQVEKKLGITKEDIGKTISIEDYNKECRADVLRFKDIWDDLTEKMGYWVDLENPYITFENEYIESVWNLLKRLYEKDFLYKGFTIQPFSPAAGTGLSSHELNQPDTYKEVTDTTIVGQFKAVRDAKSEFLYSRPDEEVFFLAWTTTPWTLPSNTALAMGKNISYLRVETVNPYTELPVTVILAKDRFSAYFAVEGEMVNGKGLAKFGKDLKEFAITGTFTGSQLEGIRYEQLLPYVKPEENALRVILGDFVTTTDGTGIVHIAPTFGADDFRVGQQNGIKGLWVEDEEGNPSPLVDRTGKFVAEMGEFAGRYVKNYKDDPNWSNPDIDIAIKLKTENRAFKVEKYIHTYPHCWRTDKPVLYYPLDSWFVRTTAVKDRLVALNQTINWQPASTGTGRFGNWLENLVDWNLSRSRYWGIPLPVWATEDMKEQKCMGSIAELRGEVEKAVAAGVCPASILSRFDDNLDLHRPFVDDIILVSESGQPMHREKDLIDVWFDSGAMPFAQWHFPFENQDEFKRRFPADFIAEGVDQTRGWFFTLHAIAVMLEDSVAYKNVLSHGLVLDKFGRKMSKRLGNTVDPFITLSKYGADATRWYMMGNSSPWENLKFNEEILQDSMRKFFGTLYNTYNFFALYANLDQFDFSEERIPVAERSEIDRWIMSLLSSLNKSVQADLNAYEPTKAIRAIDSFVVDNLSNWYVRQSRRRFWKGESGKDKLSAFQTLYECLVTVAQLMSPIAPFYSDWLFRDLNRVTGLDSAESVHLTRLPVVREEEIDLDLEERMELAQRISSLTHSIRKRKEVALKIRQPLSRIMVPVNSDQMKAQLENVKDLILAEVNVKDLELVPEDSEVLVRKAKPNFRILGPKVGSLGLNLNLISQATGSLQNHEVRELERNDSIYLTITDKAQPTGSFTYQLLREEVEIVSADIPGWSVATDGKVTVALDITLSEDLINEGVARELVNRIQNLRKDLGFEVSDRINVQLTHNPVWDKAIKEFLDYICTETLTNTLSLVSSLETGNEIEVNQSIGTILIQK
ncbi:MAG: isoleucine--tRNA ligase [Bacteroidia bacterium]|nr:isoleucine--tRNA ligase [Bacteroidia bacterium]